jgi:hypothetical protein
LGLHEEQQPIETQHAKKLFGKPETNKTFSISNDSGKT